MIYLRKYNENKMENSRRLSPDIFDELPLMVVNIHKKEKQSHIIL